jgi:6-phosphogluconolactonase (cycloisomerase 2 family)
MWRSPRASGSVARVRRRLAICLATVAALGVWATPGHAASEGVLRFFEEPGPPPPAGSPDPMLGQCLADVAGLEPIGTQRCEGRAGLETAYDVELSPDGRNLYAAAALSDSVSAFTRDTASGRLAPVGCISDAATEGCADGRALDGAIAAAVSPDGRNVYVTTRVSDSIAVFARNATTGVLTQLSGAAGCVSEGGAGGCGVARGLDHAVGVEVTADGRHVYVSGRGSDAIGVFARDAATGALTQLAGQAGCQHDSLTSVSGLQGCSPARGLDGAYSMTLSADGRNVYVASRVSDAVAAFRRNADGSLTQVAGEAGCISFAALTGCRQVGRAFDGATDVAVSPDGTSAYAVSYGGDAVSTLSRATDTGGLTYAGCLAQDGTSPECAAARALDYADAVAVTHGGANVYVAAGYADAIAVFERDSDGTLRQEPPAPGHTWTDGCLSWRGHKWAEGGTDLSHPDHSDHYCARGLALYWPYALEISGDDRHVYVASTDSDSITMLRRLDTRTYARPASGVKTTTSLVPAFAPCTAPDRVHGPPLDSPSCSRPRLMSPHVVMGSQSTGSVRLAVNAGDPATQTDEADVSLRVELTDVRRAAGGADYTGELQLMVDLQITDAQPFGEAREPMTTATIGYSAAVPCAATAAASGARCAALTSADALAPGAVPEGWRSVWQLGQARVLDGGPDGRAATADNAVLARQGVFVP